MQLLTDPQRASPSTFLDIQMKDVLLSSTICEFYPGLEHVIGPRRMCELTLMSRSTPAYQSPLRHHRRNASQHREVKETLNARSEYMNNEEDGKAEHHINQYVIKDEIGRGSFGAVHLAVDQYGNEYVRRSSKALEQARELVVTADKSIGS